MCIITGKVDKVSDTNIFAALVAPYTQLTIYSNKVALAGTMEGRDNPPTFFNSTILGGDSSGGYASVNYGSDDRFGRRERQQSNLFWESPAQWTALREDSMQFFDRDGKPVAMVLAVPLPTGDANSIKMVDMSACKNLFKELDAAIPKEVTYGSRGAFGVAQSRGGTLAVKRCGPYSYSIVPDVASFTRLKKSVFSVNPRIYSIMEKHYPRGYAFLVCIIDKSAQFSPIAYTHPSDGKNLFIPTLHEHGHSGEEVATNDWDHSIYTIDRDTGTRLVDKRNVNAEVVKAYKDPEISRFPYKSMNWKNLKKRTISGYNPNGDILIRA